MLVFVTVGSTKFDSLVQAVFQEDLLSALHRHGYTNLVVQCGNSSFDSEGLIRDGTEKILKKKGVSIEYWKFKPSLEMDYDRADLVISHAGSGTVVDVLRRGKPTIVVPNPTLLDNHQEELAMALGNEGYLKTTTVSKLPETINEFDKSTLNAFPAFNGSKFARVLDEEMGFI